MVKPGEKTENAGRMTAANRPEEKVSRTLAPDDLVEQEMRESLEAADCRLERRRCLSRW